MTTDFEQAASAIRRRLAQAREISRDHSVPDRDRIFAKGAVDALEAVILDLQLIATPLPRVEIDALGLHETTILPASKGASHG